MVDVAQLVRASDCGSEGRGFESHLPPKNRASTRSEIRVVFFLKTRISYSYYYSNSTIIMFSFENLEVYKKAKSFNYKVNDLLNKISLNKSAADQLNRAALSIILNIAEGSGRYAKKDKRHFYVMARGSVFECVAIFDYFNDRKIIDNNKFKELYFDCEEISKILFKLIQNLE